MTEKKSKWLLLTSLMSLFTACNNEISPEAAHVKALFGQNKQIEGSFDTDLAVKCHNGTFVGLKHDDVISYKGIPYAEPPIGSRRWKPSELIRENDGNYEAYYFGKSCIQTESSTVRASYYPQSEDCLTLNVWTNRSNTNIKKPVMVYIHGGSYGWGGTSDPMFDGQNFVSEHNDIILVTINYRLGLLGFIDFSEVAGGDNYKESGNLGLLDQITALQWVQKNIAAFGGDPNNVTIFGESAGAGSVSLLPLIQKSNGLFRRIIAESGSVALTFSKKECLPLAQKLLDQSGAQNMNDLLALTEDELKRINQKLNDYNNFPERDGVVLAENLYELYKNGAAANIDMIVGTNADEARYWIDGIGGLTIYKHAFPLLYNDNIKRLTKNDKRHLDAFMDSQNKENIWKITEFYNEVMFRIPALETAQSHTKNGGNTFVYYWKYPAAAEYKGACHTVELAYVFNNLNEQIYTGNNIDPQLAKTVQTAWVNFARTGDPSSDTLKWDKYDLDSRKTMIFDKTSRIESDPLKEQRLQLADMIHYNFNGRYNELLDKAMLYIKLGIGGFCALSLIAIAILLRKRKIRK